MVEHPEPAPPLPQTRTVYRPVPLYPAFGTYLNVSAPISLNVPLLGRDTIEPEVNWVVEKLRNRCVHALPPVDTPVVETASF